jgi:DnaJ-class molecular chaperone
MPVNPLRFKDTAKLWMSSRRPQNNQSTNRDFYKILGVARGANAAEIKKGYRTKAKLLHPDANPGQDTTEQFQEVNRAYEVLTDPDLKTKYDRATATLIVRATSTAWYWRRA